MESNMSDQEECPCKVCPVVVMCRNKKFLRLFQHCSMLKTYEPNYPSADIRDESKIKAIEDILNPTKWHLQKPPGETHALIMYKTDTGEKTFYIYGAYRE